MAERRSQAWQFETKTERNFWISHLLFSNFESSSRSCSQRRLSEEQTRTMTMGIGKTLRTSSLSCLVFMFRLFPGDWGSRFDVEGYELWVGCRVTNYTESDHSPTKPILSKNKFFINCQKLNLSFCEKFCLFSSPLMHERLRTRNY